MRWRALAFLVLATVAAGVCNKKPIAPDPAGAALPATAAGQKLAASSEAAAPGARVAPLLIVDELARAGSRNPHVIALQPAVPGVGGFRDVYLGRLLIAGADGSQDTVAVDASGAAEYPLTQGGFVMAAMCLGPKSLAGAPDAWERVTHCSKVIHRTGMAAPAGADSSLVMNRRGLPLEIVPMSPADDFVVGAELTVIFYDRNERQPSISVAAYRPDGRVERATTDANGTANFGLSQSGRWIVRMVRGQGADQRIGELVFEVAEVR